MGRQQLEFVYLIQPDQIAIFMYIYAPDTLNLFIHFLKGTSHAQQLTARNCLLTTQLIGLDFIFILYMHDY